jgi:nucleotide-binding universal stress UspA family protein
MNARGSTEVIIATIGLSLGMLSQNLFTMIVTMAVVTTMAMPPMLRWALSRLPLRKEEKERLEKEEFEAKGFVTNMERILLAVDESANGKFASRLAALVAASRGMPTTVFQLDKSKKSPEIKIEKAKTTAAAVAAVAQKVQSKKKKMKDETADKPDKVDVTTRVQEAPTQQAIAEEAKRGYDLLFVGIDKAVTSEGVFRNEIARIASGFSGPLAVVAALGPHEINPLHSPINILVAVAGTEVSKRAAEIAIVLAHESNGRVAALYVSETVVSHGKHSVTRATATRQYEEAILKDIVETADKFNTTIKTAMRVNVASDEAILRQAQRGHHDLIVLGVSRRPGEKLFFGNTASTVLENTKCSVLLVSS